MKQIRIQKNFYFSSEINKKKIEKRAADLAAEINQTTSYIIEQKLMEGLFPRNKEAKYLTISYLYDDEPNNIKRTLVAAFQGNIGGVEWTAVHSNYLPLVNFCQKYYKGPVRFTGNEQELPHLIEQLDLIIKRINNCVNGIIDVQERSFLADKAKNAMSMIKKLKESPETIKPCKIFETITDFFAMFDDWSITYRALGDLTELCTFEESADTRIELFNLLDELSSDWEPKSTEEEDEKILNNEFYLNRVNLKIMQEKRFADGCLTVYANDACVGCVTAVLGNLTWQKSPDVDNPRYQFKDVDIFASVVAELKKYKDEHSYKYLVIDNHRGGYASVLDLDMIRRVGFRQLPDDNPALYFLD